MCCNISKQNITSKSIKISRKQAILNQNSNGQNSDLNYQTCTKTLKVKQNLNSTILCFNNQTRCILSSYDYCYYHLYLFLSIIITIIIIIIIDAAHYYYYYYRRSSVVTASELSSSSSSSSSSFEGSGFDNLVGQGEAQLTSCSIPPSPSQLLCRLVCA